MWSRAKQSLFRLNPKQKIKEKIMKPWKIVILCSLCMFVGSMYQGCAVGEAVIGGGTTETRTYIVVKGWGGACMARMRKYGVCTWRDGVYMYDAPWMAA